MSNRFGIHRWRDADAVLRAGRNKITRNHRVAGGYSMWIWRDAENSDVHYGRKIRWDQKNNVIPFVGESILTYHENDTITVIIPQPGYNNISIHNKLNEMTPRAFYLCSRNKKSSIWQGEYTDWKQVQCRECHARPWDDENKALMALTLTGGSEWGDDYYTQKWIKNGCYNCSPEAWKNRDKKYTFGKVWQGGNRKYRALTPGPVLIDGEGKVIQDEVQA